MYMIGKGQLAFAAGFFPDSRKEPSAGWTTVNLTQWGNVKSRDVHCASVDELLASRYIANGVRAYAKLKPWAIYDPILEFATALDDAVEVMKFLERPEVVALPTELPRLRGRMLLCRIQRPCGMRCCPLYRMEQILARLDQVASLMAEHPDRSIVQFVTFVDTLTYPDDTEAFIAALRASKLRVHRHFGYGRRAHEAVYRSITMLLTSEPDIIQRYRNPETDPPAARPDDFRRQFKKDKNVKSRTGELLLKNGFDPASRETAIAITYHGPLFCETSSQHEEVEKRLREANKISGRSLFPHPYQVLAKSTFQGVDRVANIKRVVAYGFKAKPCYADYKTKDGRYTPYSERKLKGRDMALYIELCRALSFRTLQLRTGIV